MTDFITRLTELAGAPAADALVAEFGGRALYLSKSTHSKAKKMNHQPTSPHQEITGKVLTLLEGLTIDQARHVLYLAGRHIDDCAVRLCATTVFQQAAQEHQPAAGLSV